MKNSTKSALETVLAASFGVVVLIIAGLMALALHSLYKHSVGRPTLTRVEHYTGLDFPKNTRLVDGYFIGFQDKEYFVVLEFPSAETHAFVKSLPAKSTEKKPTLFSRTDRFEVTNAKPRDPDFDWWNPDSARTFIAVKIEAPLSVHMLISTDNPAVTRVYIYAWNW